ncbi:MAG: TonB-dependent receptor [Phenylobacterium sp.]|nr:MAG: TonB-dependent receptor [Phenylobacterium sp.]
MGRSPSRTSTRTLWCGVSLAAMGAAMLAAGPAAAQQATTAAATGEVSEVVVTGFRSSLAKAVEIKKIATISEDTILAEDIGKFPDLNLSESIQRIPGVAITRDAGEGREISVRGLGPQFTRVRINGMEALATTGSSDAAGGVNRGRAFDFNVFASDLFNAITVAKTPEAATEEGSLGATVDLRTARPFDYKDFTFVVSGQEGYNDLSQKYNPRGSVLIANTWMDGQFGALASLAYSRRDLKDIGTSTVRWATGNAFAPGFGGVGPNAGVTLAQADAALHPRFPRYDDYTDHQERLGGTVSLQWAPNDKTLVTLDGLYADFKGTREERYLEAPSFSVGGACTAATRANGTCGINETVVTAATIDNRNVMTAGTFNNVDLRVEDRFDELDTKFSQYTLAAHHDFNDQWDVDLLAGHVKSDFTNPIQTTLTFDQLDVQNYHYDFSQGRAPLLNYGSANLTDPNSWKLTQIRERPQRAINTYDSASGDLHWKPQDALKFSAGVDFKKYGFASTELRRSNGTSANQESVIPGAIAAIPVSSYSQLTNLNTNGLDVPAGTPTTWLVPNLNVANGLLSLYDQTAFGGAFHLGPEPALGNNNQVKEKDSGGYIQADWKTAIMGWGFRGNVGVRYVTTDETASGFSFLSGTALPVSVDHKYSDTLPSLNAVLEPSDKFQIRFAAAKVVARPDLGSLAPGVSVNTSGANRTVTSGNPLLSPFRAKTYDLSFEYYPAPGTLLSVAFFHKDIGSFVQTQQSVSTFHNNPFGIPDSVATAACGNLAGCDVTTTLWTFSAPVNTPGGPLDGYELNYQQAFTFLPSLLSHTGVLLNYTHVKSSIKYVNGAGAVVATNNLTGLSPSSYNATLYYEDDKLEARVSVAYRAKYLTRVPGQELGEAFDGTNATTNVDASVQYTWNRHLKFTFEGINLTDQFQDQFNGAEDLVSFYHHTGREFLVGFRYAY